MPRGKPKTLAEEKAELDAAKAAYEKRRDARLAVLREEGARLDERRQEINDELTAIAFIEPPLTAEMVAEAQRQESETAREAALQQNAGYQRGGTLGTVTDLDIPDALRNARANLKGAA